MKPKFLNVDLEVISTVDPAPLAEALGERVGVHFCGAIRRREYLFACALLGGGRDALERNLVGLCGLLEALPPSAVRIWKKARRRTFDIGLESGDQSPTLALRITPETLARVTKLGATIAITVYPGPQVAK